MLPFLIPDIDQAFWFSSPITTRNHRAASLAFLRMNPRGDLLPEGAVSTTFSFVAANDYRSMGPVLEDAETDRLVFTFSKGLKHGLELSMELPIASRGPGFLDPSIGWWHEHVLGQHYPRNDVALGRSEIYLPGSSRFGSAAGIGDINATLSKSINRRLALAVAIKLPTGDPSKLLGSGAFDGGFSAYYQTPIGKFLRLYTQAGCIAQGKATRLQSARGLVDQESLALVWQPNRRDAWSVMWQSEASAVATGVAGSDSAHRTLTFGYERKMNRNASLQAYFTEDGDLLNYRVAEVANIGPDFTIGLNYRIRL